MANSCLKTVIGTDPWCESPFTPGTLGINDSAAPFCSVAGDTPGSLGLNDHATVETPSAAPTNGVLELGRQFTMDQEGTVLHPYWPKGNSGITLGIGHDMGQESEDDVLDELTSAGVEKGLAFILSK